MIESIISMELPAGGHLAVRKNRICPKQETKRCRRISLVSGIHGDELEGQYICYETARRVKEHPEYLKGIVDIYPALNPLGIDMASRTVPRLEMDMNRMFPGDASGDMMERITAAVVDSIIGSDICMDLHASDIFVREIPQVRLSEDFAGPASLCENDQRRYDLDECYCHGARVHPGAFPESAGRSHTGTGNGAGA